MTTTESPTPTRLPQWAEEKIRQLQTENRSLQEENRRLKGRLTDMANSVQHSPAQGHSDTSLNRDLQAFTSADIYHATVVADGKDTK